MLQSVVEKASSKRKDLWCSGMIDIENDPTNINAAAIAIRSETFRYLFKAIKHFLNHIFNIRYILLIVIVLILKRINMFLMILSPLLNCLKKIIKPYGIPVNNSIVRMKLTPF